MARYKFYRWQNGQTFGIIAAPKKGYGVSGPTNPIIIVTDDSEYWVAKKLGEYHDLRRLIKEVADTGTKVYGSNLPQSQLPPEWRLPLMWAKREISKRDNDQSRQFLSDYEFQTDAAKRVKTIVGTGQIQYVGWETVEKQSAHSFDRLEQVVLKAIRVCNEAWNWKPVDLRVKFHSEGRAFGLAYAPGAGDHVVSLHRRMLKEYDLDTVYRVMLHELCHHYRDERFRQNPLDAHDATFCRELGKVDHTVIGDVRQCTFFTDLPDPALAAKNTKKKKQPVWSPEAGYVEFWHKKDGTFSLYWKPNKGYKWASWRIDLADETLVELLKNFSPSEWSQVEVRNHEGREHTWKRLLGGVVHRPLPLSHVAVKLANGYNLKLTAEFMLESAS